MENISTQRIARIHEEAFIIDAHFDLLSEVASRRDRGEKRVIENRYLEGLRTGKMNLIVAPIYVEDIFLPEMRLRKALSQVSHLHAEMEESPGLFRLCRNVKDAENAAADDEIGLMLAMEGADLIGNGTKSVGRNPGRTKNYQLISAGYPNIGLIYRLKTLFLASKWVF